MPLASFPEGDYRLEIKVTDKIANKTLTRDINFTVTARRRPRGRGRRGQHETHSPGLTASAVGVGDLCAPLPVAWRRQRRRHGRHARGSRSRRLDPGHGAGRSRRAGRGRRRFGARRTGTVFGVTDRIGRVRAADARRPGPYLLRAHLPGSSRRAGRSSRCWPSARASSVDCPPPRAGRRRVDASDRARLGWRS